MIINKNIVILHQKYTIMLITELGTTLKERRKLLGITQKHLAELADVNINTIARIEKGMPCRMETKRKIILALGYNLSDKHKIFGD